MCNNQNVKNKIILIAHAVIIVSGIIYFVVSRSKECGYDGGDCDEFNAQYPDCTAKNTRKIGDGKCNNEYPYNTEECGYDGGDCIDFNTNYPNCKANNAYYIGDEACLNFPPTIQKNADTMVEIATSSTQTFQNAQQRIRIRLAMVNAITNILTIQKNADMMVEIVSISTHSILG